MAMGVVGLVGLAATLCGCMLGGQDLVRIAQGQAVRSLYLASLLRAAERGVVDPGAGVWRLGWAEWHIAREVSGLFEQEQMPAPGYQGEDVDSPNREGLARNVIFSVLTVLIIEMYKIGEAPS
jgi:hypothetical protein